MLRSLYPNCGYSSETGGIMKNLRESTDNIKVKLLFAGNIDALINQVLQ
jgi:hypothetical protein